MTEKTNPTPSEDLQFSPEDFSTEELQGEVVAETPIAEEAKPQAYKIKYNGKDEEYSLDDLTSLAQKGRNYDHVIQERDALKNSEEYTLLSELAKVAGKKDGKEFLHELKATLERNKLDTRVNELIQEGAKPEHAKRLAEMELNQRAVVEEKNPLVEQFSELFKEFPETQQWKDLSEYPEDVQKMIEEGKSPLVAYSKYLATSKEKELMIAKQNEEAKQRDTGSFKTSESDKKDDDFLKGLAF